MERKNHKKTTLATLISVLLMGGAGATYANSASISEKLDLATQHLDGAASTGEAISSDGKTIATSINNRTRAFLLSGDNWATKTELGSLKSDSSGTSIVRALSADGKIAAGISSVDSSSTQQQQITGVTLLFTHSPPMGKSLQDKPQPRQVLFMRLSGRETIGQQKPTSEQ
ncbi:hypothetical protein R3J28_02825 [Xylella fastidiosa subsp. multiplex]|uniref:hypothetical protein n=1 Tax=Xylella fastidiosa TaxID=2371 RepID=UPI001CE23A57|nr:hypothetical protein [Xylella fastidiosa]